MKTMGFSDVDLLVSEDGTVSLFVRKPGRGPLEIRMSHDELLIFLSRMYLTGSMIVLYVLRLVLPEKT